MTDPGADTLLERECLEYESSMLSGLMLTCWGNPERVVKVAHRYTTVLQALGQAGSVEHKYYRTLHEKGLCHVGDRARSEWAKRPLLRRLLEFRRRREWEAAHTQSLFDEAETDLDRVRDSVSDFHARLSHRDHGDGECF